MSEDASHYIPLVDAAVLLGLSTEAVRKRIQRGTLAGLKIDGTWFVERSSLPEGQVGRSDMFTGQPNAGNQTSGRQQEDASPDVRTTMETPSVDLTPLVEMISHLHSENRQLAEAATIWQIRARQAEEKLSALEAGPTSAPEHVDAPENAPEAPQRDEVPQRGPEPLQEPLDAPVPTEVQLATGWRRWFRRVMGYEG